MNILVLGDVVGIGGCEKVSQMLPKYKKENAVDVVIVNGENSAEGNGITPQSAEMLFSAGVDVITTGNHALRRREMYEFFDKPGSAVIRPLNFHCEAPGKGHYTLDMLRYKLCVVNLQGVVFMEPLKSPFDAIDEFLKTVDTPNIIVDIHAEATSEKISLGRYLDGRVSAVLGTHTHVQTADEQIFEGGTGYISDLGMCGSKNSVLGVKTEQVIRKIRTNLPTKLETVKENCVLHGVLLSIDSKIGKCTTINRVKLC